MVVAGKDSISQSLIALQEELKSPSLDIEKRMSLVYAIQLLFQAKAITPLKDAFYILSENWLKNGVITRSSPPIQATLKHLLSESPHAQIDTSNEIMLFESKVDINAINSLLSVDLNDIIDETRALFAFRDRVCQLAPAWRVKDNDSFTMAWHVTSRIMTHYQCPLPINSTGTQAPPVVPPPTQYPLIPKQSTRWFSSTQRERAGELLTRYQNNFRKVGADEPRIAYTGRIDRQLATRNNINFPVTVNEAKLFIPPLKTRNGAIPLGAFHPKTDNEPVVFYRFLRDDVTAAVRSGKCEHCGRKAHLNTQYYFLIENNVIMVGQSCIDEHFNHHDFSKQLDTAFSFIREWDKTKNWGQLQEYDENAAVYFSTTAYLALAQWFTVEEGFVKSHEKGATKERINELIQRKRACPTDLENVIDEGAKFPCDIDNPLFDTAKDIKQCLLGEPDSSDFIRKAKQLLGKPTIYIQDNYATGMLASLPSAYNKIQRQKHAINNPTNTPFGKVKARGPLKLRVTHVQPNQEALYPYVKYQFQDDAGRRFSWKGQYTKTLHLQVGKTYYMVATIKGHSLWQGIHYTTLTRCAEFESVDPNAPTPDFFAGTEERKFKETFEIEVLPYDGKQNIDGNVYLHIKRSWRETRKILESFFVIPTMPIEKLYPAVMKEMISQTGIKRDNLLTPYKDIHHRDEQFVQALRDAVEPLFSEQHYTSDVWFLVDDAHAPLMTDEPSSFGPTNSTPDDVSRRQPRLFREHSLAVRQAKKMTAGRVTSMRIKSPAPIVLKNTFKLIDAGMQEKFKQEALANGSNLLVTYSDDINGLQYRIEPLGWHPEHRLNEVSIIHSEAFHRGRKEALNSRLLQGLSIVTLSGLTPYPEVSKYIHQFLQHEESETLKKLGLNPIKKPGDSVFSTPLNTLIDDGNKSLLKRRRIIAVDDTTPYYIHHFGADIINLRFQTCSQDDDVVEYDSIVMVDENEEPIIWLERALKVLRKRLGH